MIRGNAVPGLALKGQNIFKIIVHICASFLVKIVDKNMFKWYTYIRNKEEAKKKTKKGGTYG